MALNIRKVDLNNLRAYTQVVGDRQALLANQDGSVKTIEELENEVGGVLANVANYDRNFLLSSIPNRDKIYSSVYNSFVTGVDTDFRVLAVQIVQLSEAINRVTDTMNIYHRNILQTINNRISEVTNIGKMADAEHPFNIFVSDTFSNDSNAFKFSDSARVTDMGGTYRIGTFGNTSYVQTKGDAYITSKVLNQDVSVLSENGDVLSKNIEDAFSSLVFSEKEVKFNGRVAGGDLEFPGVVIGVIITLPSNRLINTLAYSDFASSPPSLVGVYTSLFETSVPESTDWVPLTNYKYDTKQKGRIELTFEKISAQSIMLLFGQKNRRNTKHEINPDEVARLIQQVESKDITKAVDIRKVFMEALLESGRDSNRKDQIVYDTPTSVSTAASEVQKFINRLIQLLRPAVTITSVNGFLYDIGIHGLTIQYNEYRTFGIFESVTRSVAGNVLSAQLSKSDMMSNSVFIKYFLMFETLKKRMLGIKETRTSDIFVIDDSDVLTYPLDFYGKNPNDNFTISINGTDILPAYYTIHYGDKNNKIIVSVTINSIYIQYGNIVKITYDISDLDTNYASYDPSFVDVRQEAGFPNIKRNLPRDPVSSKIAIIRNNSGDAFVPMELGDTLKNVQILLSGESEILYLIDRNAPGFSRVNSEIYSSTVLQLKGGDSVSQIVSPDHSIQLPVHDLFYGIIDEIVESGSIASESGIYTKFEYIPGSVVVSVNNDIVYADAYTDNATDLKLVNLRTRLVYPGDDIRVSYVPLDSRVYAVSGESNIASFNKLQTIAGTDASSAVTLDSYPFVDYRITNDIGIHGQWNNIDNIYSLRKMVSLIYMPIQINVNGRAAKNITDYVANTTPKFDEFVDANRNYQYYVEGNRVLFNTQIVEDINVGYYTLGSRVKLRAELFRNDLSDQGNSPELYDYGLMINAQ